MLFLGKFAKHPQQSARKQHDIKAKLSHGKQPAFLYSSDNHTDQPADSTHASKQKQPKLILLFWKLAKTNVSRETIIDFTKNATFHVKQERK